MRATLEISAATLREYINRAVTDVFQTMVGRTPKLESRGEMERARTMRVAESERPQVIGTVGFVGECNGLIYLHLDLAFARACTSQLLGMTDGELDAAGDEVVNDAIGELTNMTVGSFKNALSDAGHPCKLTIPSILRGTNLSIEPIGSVVRNVYYFACGEHRIVADLLMKAGD